LRIQVQKILLESLDQVPEIIRSALLKPKMSTASRLKWAGMAIRLLYDPVDRAMNDSDRKNKREAANIRREVVPELQKIRERNPSERLRRKARSVFARHRGRGPICRHSASITG
jgi:hypothetical protein